jgi:hypothetical protein
MRLSDNISMPEHIKIEGDLNANYRPLMALSSEEATRMSEANAQQVTHSATAEYPIFSWRVVRIMGFSECIVEGSEKKGA